MPIYRIQDKRVLFIHIPKTGGTSVETFLRTLAPEGMHSQGDKILLPATGARLSSSVPLQHFHAELLKATFPDNFFDYAFMIVRDPLARAISAYNHSRSMRRPEGYLPFHLWLKLMLPVTKQLPYVRNNHMRAQRDFMCFDAEIFKFEDGMAHILDQVAQRLGVAPPLQVPHERRLPPSNVVPKPEDMAAIAAHYQGDYQAFGY